MSFGDDIADREPPEPLRVPVPESARFALAVADAVLRADWALARWAARKAVAARAVEAWDAS